MTDGLLADNQIANSGADGIYLQNTEGWAISGNTSTATGRTLSNAARLYASTISGNYIEDFGAARRSGTWYRIAGTAQGSLGSVIADNKVFNDIGEQPGAHHVYIAVTETDHGTGICRSPAT